MIGYMMGVVGLTVFAWLTHHRLSELEDQVEALMRRAEPTAHECDDCGIATFVWVDKSDHHGGTKRVCAYRDACHSRSRG